MNDIVVHKLDAHGRELWTYPGRLLHQIPGAVTLQAAFDREDTAFAGVQLRRGDRFVETFYIDRWYNVFEIHDVDTDELKMWYCNLARPARIENGHVYAEDLALDVVILPDRRVEILDADEYAALDLSRAERAAVERAVHELRALAERRQAPFR
ncbi:MAG TPA: DUF402 domain-containing protein [Anaerolineales bacterium]|nr:DUF402 domain-containing protein [Anaerolineales bacterium]